MPLYVQVGLDFQLLTPPLGDVSLDLAIEYNSGNATLTQPLLTVDLVSSEEETLLRRKYIGASSIIRATSSHGPALTLDFTPGTWSNQLQTKLQV